MTQQIENVLESGRQYGWYEPFLRSVVLPNAGVFAFLVTWGEFLTGISTTFGAMGIEFGMACHCARAGGPREPREWSVRRR